MHGKYATKLISGAEELDKISATEMVDSDCIPSHSVRLNQRLINTGVHSFPV